MAIDKFVKALLGAESLLLILPKEIGNKLNIADQEWLTFEVKNKELVVKKIADVERLTETTCMKEEEIGAAFV